MRIRPATLGDIPALEELIPLSARALSTGWYSTEQVESAIRYVFGVDTQLVRDRTYFVAADGDAVVGCGGWSRRATLYGGDQMKTAADPLLDPGRDPARIRAFFIHPERARQGIGAAILIACIDGAFAAGFRRLELMATLPGVPLYKRHGFRELEATVTTLPDGVTISFIRMGRDLADVVADPATHPPAAVP